MVYLLPVMNRLPVRTLMSLRLFKSLYILVSIKNYCGFVCCFSSHNPAFFSKILSPYFLKYLIIGSDKKPIHAIITGLRFHSGTNLYVKPHKDHAKNICLNHSDRLNSLSVSLILYIKAPSTAIDVANIIGWWFCKNNNISSFLIYKFSI